MSVVLEDPLGTVTLREIEDGRPCFVEYIAFLRDIRSNCVSGGWWEHWYRTDLAFFGPDSTVYHKFAEPRYGPDDPIRRADILALPSSGGMTPLNRVRWYEVTLTKKTWTRTRTLWCADFNTRPPLYRSAAAGVC